MRTTLFPLLVAALVGLVYSQQQIPVEDIIPYQLFDRSRRNLNLFTKLHRIREGAKRFDPLSEIIDYA
ncbi:hypothetical protein Y032_0025g1244 [Ancylostoma ceylanicum]|uniref:Uncharacterized protein n=1 Tax=Ancylostoma ceylanicum TaxID=53326 RepID=A0A016UUV8_9BILA|nr:hypothetical protein Y032_0025g1244 [Ancylostoma ceylanicum]